MRKSSFNILSSQKIKGLGIVLYCNKCKRNLTKDICEETGKSLEQCPFKNRHVFKEYMYIPGMNNKRLTKNLKAKTYIEAVKEAQKFRDEVMEKINRGYDIEVKHEIINKNQSQEIPVLFKHALGRYIGWLHNETVPLHLQKERSKEHVLDIERALRSLIQCLKENGYDLDKFEMSEINDSVIGKVYEYLVNKQFANRTFNKYFSFYTSFMKWYIDEYNSQLRNWFVRAPRKKLNSNPEMITYKEFAELLKIISKENEIKGKNNEKYKQNLYPYWLIIAFRLASETGCRREELINLIWNNIHGEEGNQYITVENIKVNRIQKRNTKEEKKYTHIPVTESLKKLLNELDMEKFKNTDNYILAPELKDNRIRIISDKLSNGFTHYYSQLNTGRNLTFKCLRKTYITNLKIYMGGDINTITGHSNEQVIDRHYVDKIEIAKAARGFSVFTNNDRKDELNNIRNEKNSKNRQLDKEV